MKNEMYTCLQLGARKCVFTPQIYKYFSLSKNFLCIEISERVRARIAWYAQIGLRARTKTAAHC